MRMTILVACLWLVTIPLWGKIVFYSKRDGNLEIYTMNSDGSNVTRLTFNEAIDASPAWSPNGQQIVFHSYRDGGQHAEIYVMDADGQNQRRLTHRRGADSQPDWSPDGSQIVFTSDRNANAILRLNIFVMDTNGGNVRQVTRMGFASNPHWSPDGKRILFNAVTNSGREVYMVDINGRNRWKVSLPNIEAGMFARGWSPDGKKILYMEAIGSNRNDATLIIATLNPIRQGVLHFDRVPLPKMPISIPAWGADGKSILFTTRPPDGPWNLDRNIYRFRLTDRKLIQLTHHIWKDSGPHEWNSRLSVQPQRLLPLFWGEVKSNRLPH